MGFLCVDTHSLLCFPHLWVIIVKLDFFVWFWRRRRRLLLLPFLHHAIVTCCCFCLHTSPFSAHFLSVGSTCLTHTPFSEPFFYMNGLSHLSTLFLLIHLSCTPAPFSLLYFLLMHCLLHCTLFYSCLPTIWRILLPIYSATPSW